METKLIQNLASFISIQYGLPWNENFEKISTKYIIPAGCKENILNQLEKLEEQWLS